LKHLPEKTQKKKNSLTIACSNPKARFYNLAFFMRKGRQKQLGICEKFYHLKSSGKYFFA
jgi:hypothetical protein